MGETTTAVKCLLAGTDLPRLENRIHSKVEIISESGCWIWMGYVCPKGYGSLKISGATRKAHRASYELFYRKSAEGKFVCHSCDVPSCVNPAHLWLGDNNENIRDMVSKGRSCKNGGESNGRALLAEHHIPLIRQDTRTQEEIAKSYGVSQQTISMIKAGQIWGYVK